MYVVKNYIKITSTLQYENLSLFLISLQVVLLGVS